MKIYKNQAKCPTMKNSDFTETHKDLTSHILHLAFPENNNSKDDSICFNLSHFDDVGVSNAFIATFQNSIVIHTLTATPSESRYAEEFYDIMIDTSCTRGRTGGILR